MGSDGDLRTVAEQDRERLTQMLQEDLGRVADRIEPVSAGLGNRRFYRIGFRAGEPQQLLARVEDLGPPSHDEPPPTPQPPPWLEEPPLEPIRGLLESAGMPVPRSYGHRPNLGIDLLEDVGDRTLLDATGSERETLYRAAAGLIPRLQRITPATGRAEAFGRFFDRRLLDSKLWKWLHWAIPGLLGRPASPNEEEAGQRAFDLIAELVENAPRRLSHRDFKAENLHVLPSPASAGTSDTAGLVMIDLQGAFMAPPEYDLVCLLKDLQTDLDPTLAATLFEETRTELPDLPDLETSRVRFDALATARLCKDVAHVIQAGVERGDFRRWHEIPRGLELLGEVLGRLQHTFPEFRALNSVMPALTARARSSDIARRGVKSSR